MIFGNILPCIKFSTRFFTGEEWEVDADFVLVKSFDFIWFRKCFGIAYDVAAIDCEDEASKLAIQAIVDGYDK